MAEIFIPVGKKEVTYTVDFTDKDITLVGLLAEDFTVIEAAKQMKLNARTLEGYVLRLKRRFGFKSIAGLVGFFYKNNLL